MVAYGIVGAVSNIDPDKVYDYHTAFDIKPTEVVYNVDINANRKKIKNIKLDRQNDNSELERKRIIREKLRCQKLHLLLMKKY